jgi:hypothetical protein
MSFQVIAAWLILNLTVAAVIDGLNEAQANNSQLINKDNIEEYLSLWQDFDPELTFRMTMNQFFFFLSELPPPFVNVNLRSTRLDLKEPGWLVNEEKGYKVKMFGLLNIVEALKIKIEKDSHEQEAYVNFDDVTRAIVFRTVQMEKDKKNKADL